MTEEISKTKRKKDMLELQGLGEKLVSLNSEQLHQLKLPELLRQAIIEAKAINKFGALRRQLQYIGRLMRDIDPEPIRRGIERWEGLSKENTAHLHLIERWRTRLLEDDAALTEFARIYPQTDTQRLRTLIRNTKAEQANGKPLKQYRVLFKELRELIPEPKVAAGQTADAERLQQTHEV